jgi:short/branched chain acyl-CoA dehydrogenase
VALELDEAEEFSPDLTRKMGEIGLFGMFVGEAYEGRPWTTFPTSSPWKRSPGWTVPRRPPLRRATPWGSVRLYYFGNEEQKQKYLPKLCNGEALWGFGLTEPTAGSDAGGSKTTAVRDGNEWVINGSKIFITNAASEMTLGVTVQAITGTRPNGKPEYTCFIVEQRHQRVQGRAHEKEDDVAVLQYGGALFRRCARAV